MPTLSGRFSTLPSHFLIIIQNSSKLFREENTEHSLTPNIHLHCRLYTYLLLTFVNCLCEAKLNALLTSSSLTKILLTTFVTVAASFTGSKETQISVNIILFSSHLSISTLLRFQSKGHYPPLPSAFVRIPTQIPSLYRDWFISLASQLRYSTLQSVAAIRLSLSIPQQ